MNKTLHSEIQRTFSLHAENKDAIVKEGSKYWNRVINKWERCGMDTINFVNELSPALVLDLGCGENQYKHYIPNLIGIDLVNELADIKSDITKIPYDDNVADAVLCFGSINFGDTALIETQLLEMYRVLKPGGYAVFRGNTDTNHDTRNIYYGWTTDLVNFWTKKLNLQYHQEPITIVRTHTDGRLNLDWVDKNNLRIGATPRTPYRLFWIWKK
jgi:SAM-dependent methyltransferase